MSGDVLDLIDGTLRDYEVSADAMRWTPEPIQFDLGHIVNSPAFAEFGRQLGAAFAEMTRQLGLVSVPLVKLARQIAHDADARERPRWHVRRCTTCNPACANTAPWGPAGREYRRRRKARARRNRRR